MTNKEAVLQAVGALPDSATWAEITDVLLAAAARHGSPADFAQLYRTQITSDDLAEYAAPNGDIPLDAVLAELEARVPAPVRESA
jgi:hypothetical protein